MNDTKFIIQGIPELEGDLDISFSEQLFRNLKLGGNIILQIDNATGKSVTYRDILQKSVNLAEALRSLGVQKGDVIGMSSENRFEFTVCVVAVFMIGAINAPMNVLYTKNEILHALNISKPKMIFCSQFTVDNIMNAIKSLKSPPEIIAFGDGKPNASFYSYEDLIKKQIDVQTFKLAPVDFMTHPAVILNSSGTTGLAKGVVLTHYNLSICTNHLRHLMDSIDEENSCLLSVLPWFHAFGFITHLCCINLHLKCVFLVKFEGEPFLSAIEKYKVEKIYAFHTQRVTRRRRQHVTNHSETSTNQRDRFLAVIGHLLSLSSSRSLCGEGINVYMVSVTFLVPPLMVFLAKHPSVSKYNLTSLKEIWCGAAPLSKELQIAVTERIGIKNIKQGYGLSETTLAVLHNGNSDIKYGSCGQVVPGTSVKVMDLKTGESLGSNKEGELCFKGALMMKGYIGDAESTNKLFDSEGWLHTGDVGYYDDDKFFYIVDRFKELIKYNGFQVPPAELEALVLQHPQIKDVGVVGRPDERVGEYPVAFVVRQPGSTVTEKEIVNFVATRVSTHKQLRGGVYFIDEIPKNPSGKILRRILRDRLQKLPRSKL